MQGKRNRVQQTEGDNQSHEEKKKDGAQMGQREPQVLKRTRGQEEE